MQDGMNFFRQLKHGLELIIEGVKYGTIARLADCLKAS